MSGIPKGSAKNQMPIMRTDDMLLLSSVMICVHFQLRPISYSGQDTA